VAFCDKIPYYKREKNMAIKILGTGCPSCKKLEVNVKEALKQLNSKDNRYLRNYGIWSYESASPSKRGQAFGLWKGCFC